MNTRRTIVIATLGFAVLCFGAAPVCARDASDHSTQELVDALVQRFSKVLLASPTRSSPSPDTAVVLLEGKAMPLASQLRNAAKWRVLTQDQLVAEQRAVFIIISQLGMQGPDMLVDYEIPSNASFGTLRILGKDDKLVFKSEESYRSSSGSRATYARLYGGLVCRDGTEMAHRYNFYARSSESGVCARPTFPGTDSPLEW